MPYSWWENAQTSIFNAKETTSYKALKGIYVDKRMKNIYDGINKYVVDNTNNRNDTYFFNVPLFYVLNNKLPPYKLVGHWFDVTPTNALRKEYNSFLEKPAPNLVIYQPLTGAFRVHQNIKHTELLQKKFYNKINEFVANNKYEFVESFSIPTRRIYNDKAKNGMVKITVILQNKRLEDISIQELTSKFSKYTFTINEVYRNNLINNNTNHNFKLQINDLLKISGSYEDLFDLVPNLGVQPVDNSIWNSITIYKKKTKLLGYENKK